MRRLFLGLALAGTCGFWRTTPALADPPLALVETSPADGTLWFPPSSDIVLRFSRPMDAGRAKPFFKLEDLPIDSPAAPAEVSLEVVAASAPAVLAFRASLKPEHAYRLVVSSGLPEASGGAVLARGVFVRFETPAAFRFLGAAPETSFCLPAALSLAFSNPLSTSAVRERLSLSTADLSAAELTRRVDVPGRRVWIDIAGLALEPRTTLEGRLLPGLKDDFGGTANAEPFRWRTGDLCPSARLLDEGVIDGKPWLPLRLLNVSSGRLRLTRLKPDELIPSLGAPLHAPDVDRTFRPSTSLNTPTWYGLDLGEALGPQPGIVLASFEPPGRPALDAVANVTHTGLTLKTSPDSTVVWTTFLETGSPRPGVPVELRDGSNRVLWKGKTDKNGSAAAPGWRKDIYLLARPSGDFAVLGARRPPAADDAPERAVFIFTDRDAYAEGETVRFKGFVRELDRGDWAAASLRRLEYRLLDSSGRESKTGTVELKDSAFDLAFDVPEGARTGTWALVLEGPSGALWSRAFAVAALLTPLSAPAPGAPAVSSTTAPGAARLEVKASSRFTEPGQAWSAEITADGADGTPVLGLPVHAVLWSGPGGANGSCRHAPPAVASADFTFQTSSPAYTWVVLPGEAGPHCLELKAEGTSGAEAWFFAASGPAREPPASEPRLELVSDKAEYRPGETARILVRSPWGRSSALAAFEREGVLRTETLRLEPGASVLSFPISEADVPNVGLHLTVLKGRTADRDFERPDQDPGRPAALFGSTELRVSPETRRLKVDLTAERLPDGEIEVKVAAAKGGTGVPADVALLAVEEGAPLPPLPDPMPAFYLPRPLLVETSDNRHGLGLAPPAEEPPQAGPAETPAAAPAAEPASLSRRFSAPLWRPGLKTGPDGRASVRFRPPAPTMKLRLRAVAQAGTAFGSAETLFTPPVTLEVSPRLPAFARVGDRFEAGLAVRNLSTSPAAGTVEAEWTGDAAAAFGESTRTFALAGSGAAELDWSVTATATGTLALRARSGDVEEPGAELLVRPAPPPPPAEEAGLKLERTWTPLDASQADAPRVGGLYAVTLTLTAPGRLARVIVEDPVAAGFDVADADGGAVRKEGSVVFDQALESGTRAFRYIVRARFAGSFRRPPTTARSEDGSALARLDAEIVEIAPR